MNKTDKALEAQLKESYSLWNGINELYSRWARTQGLTYYSLFVLYAVYHAEGRCCQKDICEKWSMPKQTVSSILKNYEKEGYIVYLADPEDKRNKFIGLTEEGRRYAKRVLEKLFCMEHAVIKRVGQQNMESLLEANRLFYQYFQEELREEL